ncbi:MAG TPA: YigZ family protein [Arenibacter sp.]|nr:YigZ family protein [Arenibacter sp.]
MDTDTYKTLGTPSEEVLLKEKKSKFYGYAYPILNEEEVRPIIEELRKRHHTANHVCYAWQLGVEDIKYRTNDDGEPNNSAGIPIYGQIQAFGVTNVLIAVARIFGGTKLGVGGLMSAYKTTAQMALENGEIIERTLQQKFLLSFDYPEMDKVMRTIKQYRLEIVSQKMEMDCSLVFSVRKQHADHIAEVISQMHPLKLKKLNI